MWWLAGDSGPAADSPAAVSDAPSAAAAPAARFVRSLVRLQIDSFSLFWESRNLGNSAEGYVPGYRVPRYSGLFESW